MAVKATWGGGYLCETAVLESGQTVIGDEPIPLGGENKGPNPFALIQASLANCTIVTVVGEAKLLGVDLDSLEVDVKHKQNHTVAGPHDPKQRELKITRFTRNVRLSGDFDKATADRLRWAAENCPISNSFIGAIDVVTNFEHVTA
jgi:uncharacterized OsmC-like protein